MWLALTSVYLKEMHFPRQAADIWPATGKSIPRDGLLPLLGNMWRWGATMPDKKEKSYTGLIIVLCAALFLIVSFVLGALVFSGGEGELPQVMRPAAAGYEPLVQQPIDRRPILVLDAGHGGHDPGAVTADEKLTEAEVTWDIAERVAALLSLHEGDLLVVRTAEAGEYRSARERARVAVDRQAALLLSLHLNADYGTAARGFECYPAPPGRLHHSESTRFAELIVQEMRETALPIRGEEEGGIFYAFYEPAGAGSYTKRLYDAALFDGAARRDESFGVLDHSGCPAVLTELWYLSNIADRAGFSTEAGRDELARCLYRAVCAYFGLTPQS